VRPKARGLFTFALSFFDGGPNLGSEAGAIISPSSTTSFSAGRFRVTARSSVFFKTASGMDEDVNFWPTGCSFKTRRRGAVCSSWGAGVLEGLALWIVFAFLDPEASCSSSPAGGAMSFLRF